MRGTATFEAERYLKPERVQSIIHQRAEKRKSEGISPYERAEHLFDEDTRNIGLDLEIAKIIGGVLLKEKTRHTKRVYDAMTLKKD